MSTAVVIVAVLALLAVAFVIGFVVAAELRSDPTDSPPGSG